MKCGKCKLWNWKEHKENNVKELKKQYKMFGKALGMCTCEFGGNYPMFNYEKCPKEC